MCSKENACKKFVLTKGFPAYLSFQIACKTYNRALKQYISMWTEPVLNIQYEKASKQFRGKKKINMLIAAKKEKKSTFSPNLNTGNNRISCHFLQAPLQLAWQRFEVCVCACA